MFKVDFDLAKGIAMSFSMASGLGCVLATAQGELMFQTGYTCDQCGLCARLDQDRAACGKAHEQALQEAQRFGGRYIYFCPHGLGFTLSPIMGSGLCEGQLRAGPFLMADSEEYLAVELAELLRNSPEQEQALRLLLQDIPLLSPPRVSAVSQMLHLAASFVSNAQEVSRMRHQEASDQLQGQLADHILQIKQQQVAPYPYQLEQELLEAMSQNRRKDANRLLNALLSNILVISGMSFSRMKSHITELLVLMSRKAVENGADSWAIQQSMHEHHQRLARIQGFEELCFWLSEVVNHMMVRIFDFGDARHAGALQRSIAYLRSNLHERLSLKDLADQACLSPAYYSRVFKQEVGKTVQQFLVDERMELAAKLMHRHELTFKEIAALAGIHSQSLFNRQFKERFGLTPGEYRKALQQQSS